jgi:predicted porin
MFRKANNGYTGILSMIISNSFSAKRAVTARASTLLSVSVVVGSLLAASGMAHAQGAPAPTPMGGSSPATIAAQTVDPALTWHGITLSGALDMGLQYQPHAAPVSDYYAAGGYNLIQADSLRAVAGITPNNLSQSNITLSGVEPLAGDLSGVFKLQTLFQPNSGNLTDGLKSLVLNNGKAAINQNNGQDSDAAGQAFAGALYAGVSSPTFGALTYGWQTTLLSDGVVKYDPNNGAYAFSLIGQSGTARGGGDTEDKRFKNSLKYLLQYQIVHFGAMYQFSDSGSGTKNTAYQFQVGGEFAGLSVDAFYSKVYDAISAASLSAAQVTDLVTPGNAAAGYSISNSLSATISDNTAYAILASYAVSPIPVKVFAGYEHVKFADPSTPLAAGAVDVGGYILAFTTNNHYTTDKNENIYWAGAKWAVVPRLDLTAAFYEYQADAFTAGADGPCGTTLHGNCSGTERVGSLDAVFHYSKRFDGYFGAMYSKVEDGIASGFKYTNTINPTIGVRFRF